MEFLSILWFILIAVLWTVYLVLEGFDFGVGMLLPIAAKNDRERTQLVRSIGPHWDGNEVWLLTAGGATFAAFPAWYATMFSGMYLALFLILVLLIVRITAIEWRSKLRSERWRANWDWFQTVASFGVPLVLGVAFSNLVQGMQIEAQNRLTGAIIPPEQVAAVAGDGTTVYNLTGGFFSLFTPFTLLGGVMLLLVCLSHGIQFVSLKTDGLVAERANRLAGPVSVVATLLAAVWVVWGQFAYSANVLAWIPLVIAALALITSAAFSQPALRSPGKAFAASAIGIASAVAWIFSAMAPNVMKSAIAPEYSLTIPLASSTNGTLTVMTIVAVVLVPIVLAYTLWSYWVFRDRVGHRDVTPDSGLWPAKIRLGANFLTGKQ
ncbi:cytochrome d ubiquinol oxidase subunit II [Scrofimicrobium sp. R131]|uniref:Cytochrome d ubiquinol oxidase subunit II n=1 Tax=Scrofimicrobium appendicitidis TaxID=3079930 RepID=A0AAU7V5J4_9ACTO